MKLSTALLGLATLAAPASADDPERVSKMIKWSDDLIEDAKDEGQNIIGGRYIEPGSRPWLVPVIGFTLCAGSLISPSVVMTAASCVIHFDYGHWHPPAWVEFNRYSWFNDTDVERVYIKDRSQCDGDVVYHPNYNATQFDNDVALVFLPNPVTDFTPVQLNEDKNVPKDGDKVNVAGWGYPSYDGPAEATLKYVPNEACSKKPYRWPEEYILDSTMCAVDYEKEKSICWGDSGAPLNLVKQDKNGEVLTNIQVGISSWDRSRFPPYKCYHRAFPNGFTRVSEIADWVKETVCARKGELCKQSKAGKMSKMVKKYPDTCVPVSTYAPSSPQPTWSPSVTPQPWTPYPTPLTTWNSWPTFSPYDWPTWMPTKGKSGKV